MCDDRIPIGGSYSKMDIATRGMALRLVAVFLGGTLVGSILPEWGNVLAIYIGYRGHTTHIFNPFFLAFGIIGVCLALYIGYRSRVGGS